MRREQTMRYIAGCFRSLRNWVLPSTRNQHKQAYMVLAKRSIVIRSLRAVNLNLLPALRVLLRFRQVSRAAKALNMSQSSVSEILGSLRHLFHDELVVSEGNRMRLTALGERLESQIDTPLKLIERLTNVDTPGHSATTPTIDIAASDYTMA